MKADVRRSEKGSSAAPELVEDLKLRLHGAQTQEAAARAEVRRLLSELSVARRLLRFYVHAPSPPRVATATDTRPVPAMLLTAEAKFHLDACERHGAHTLVTGWAFCPVAAWDGQAAEIVLLLRADARAYTVATGRMPRPDIAAYFAVQPEDAGGARGLEGTGFTCKILNGSLPTGVDFEVVLRLECAGLACERPTGQWLRV